MKLIVALVIGLVGGVTVGFCLGHEYAPRCVTCASRSEESYRRGFEDGWSGCLRAVRLELDRMVGHALTAVGVAGICRRLSGEGGVTHDH